MSEKKDGDDIRGLCVVDDASHEEAAGKSDDGAPAVKIDATACRDACENQAAEGSYVEEAEEEKINLLDVLNEGEPEKESKDSCQNSTLIITTEEHLDATACDDSAETARNVNQPEDPKSPPVKSKSKSEDHSYLWVSNIGRHVKATDLKKLFSQMGKVATAKILTNGKNYFGYVSVDSAETVGKCIKQLNNISFDGKKIIVSKDRPDLRETKQAVKESRRKKNDKIENKPAESKVDEEKQEARNEEEEAKDDAIAELRKKLERLRSEIGRYKWKIVEYQRRHEGMRKKCGNLEKELKETQYKMRADRRRLNQDREQFEKNKKMEQIRLEADRAVVNKELGEVRKLREHLKAKIDEIKAQSKKNSKRSPPQMERSRSPRVRSPAMRVGSRIGYRSEERLEKKRKRDDPPRGRTPPPPPKLSNGMGKKRNDTLSSHRQYFETVEKRPSPLEHGHGYEYRHKAPFAPPQEVSRPPWQAPYSKDPRRVTVAPSGGQGYPADPRYGGGYQFPSSSVAVPPRSYYPEFGKPYGHY